MGEATPEKTSRESTAGSSESAAAEQTDWQRKVLFHHRTRTALGNERKYLGWLRVSLGMITLGFVVERLDLFLDKTTGLTPTEVRRVLLWAPLLIYGMGCITIAAATWDFFADRKRIADEQPRNSRILVGLVLATLVCLLLIAVLLWVPGVQRLSP
jgi:uncharacterized membrane protein YidH (DUF202 family)